MDDVLKRLTAFFTAMNEWETAAINVSQFLRSDPIHQPIREQLAAIQREYCAPKAKLRSYTVSDPPTYSSLLIEDCTSVSKSKVKVNARDRSRGVDDQLTFVLVKKQDQWFVSEHIFTNCEGKAHKFYL
jgi:hypothetical protein